MTRANHSDTVWSIDDLELELRKLPGVRAAGFDDLDDMLLVQLHVSEGDEYSERIDRAERSDQPVPVSASRIAARHSDRPVAVEVVRWRTATLVVPPSAPPAVPEAASFESTTGESTAGESAAAETPVAAEVAIAPAETGEPNRARLLAVLAFPDTDELEVHLVLDGKRTIGRAPVSAGIEGAVEATLEAVRELGIGISPRVQWARALDDESVGDHSVVAVAVDGVDSRSPLHYGLASGTSLIDAASRATLDALNRRLSRGA
jgi:hypothetical protein